MKVWELMATLSKLEVGMDVWVTAYMGGTLNDLCSVRCEDDHVILEGNSRYTDDLDAAHDEQEQK